MKSKLLCALLLVLASTSVFAQQVVAPTLVTTSNADLTILNVVTASLAKNASLLLTQAATWLASFMALQFVWTQIGLLRSGTDLEAIFGKLIGSLLWFGICIVILNKAPEWINSVGVEAQNKWLSNIPTVGGLITSTLAVFGGLSVLAIAAGKISEVLGNIIMYMSFGLLFVGIFFSFKVFMLQLELALIVLLSPLSFAFLGMNALKDQGIAPFKSLIAYVYKVILFGIIFSAFGQVEQQLMSIMQGLGPSSFLGSAATVIEAFGVGISSYVLLAILLFKSDAIAEMLAGGHSSMGTSDVAGAAAAGAAAGAAIGAGSSAVAGAAQSQPMGAWLAKIPGGMSGSVRNASQNGTGGVSGPAPMPKSSPSMSSLSNSGAAVSTNPKGVPISENANPTPRSDTALGTTPYQAQNGSDAGISGANSPDKTDQNLGGNKKSFGDALGKLGDHVQGEKSRVQVSISAHHDL